ncbi:membrane protein [Clostridia bacterium]|nr:membrane protein [Clostridia bacterium]
MKVYTTVQNDTWDIASYRVYGDEGYMGELIKANPKHVSTVVFSGGVSLNVPEFVEASPVTNLPPWRKAV